MRIVLIGASPLAVATAKILIQQHHDVVIIEADKAKVDALSQKLDCGFIHGDGSKPAILREVDPERTDFLFCLTNEDKDNILAGVVGRSLGFARVIPKIEDSEFEHICIELGLQDTIIPDRAIARILGDMVAGRATIDVSTLIKGEVRFFSFVAGENDEGPVSGLKLPSPGKAVCIYRNEEFLLPENDTKIERGDQVVVITHSKNLAALRERWGEKAKP